MFHFVLVAGLAALAKASYIPSNEPTDEGIVGGRNATIEEYPYQLVLLLHNMFICGASLIKPNVALTAAHCTQWSKASDLKVRAGSNYTGNGGELANVRNKYEHPKYQGRETSWDYDVTVLVLDKSLSLSASIQTISLQSVGVAVPEGAVATATGWGSLNNQWELPLTLQAVEIPKVTQQKCAVSYKPLEHLKITERMTCYGYTEEGKGVCKGDSGGPIVVNGKLAGITSWTKGGCAQTGYPSVFAKISNKEIADHINKYIAGF